MPWPAAPMWADHVRGGDQAAQPSPQPVWTSATASRTFPVWYPPSAGDVEEWIASVTPRFPRALAARARRVHPTTTAQAVVSAGGAADVGAAAGGAAAPTSSGTSGGSGGGRASSSQLESRVQMLEELVSQLSAEVLWLKAKVKAL